MTGLRAKAPAHPAGFVIEPLCLSITTAVDVLGVTRAALSPLLNERTDLWPEMAIRIEKAFGVSMETLMQMQSSFDIAEVRKRVGDNKAAPYRGKE